MLTPHAIVFSIVAIGFAVAASADPSVEEACIHFSDGAITGDIRVAYGQTEAGPFETVSLKLQRYETLVGPATRYYQNADGRRIGAVKAMVLCLADVKDRRVLEISVLPDPNAPERPKPVSETGLITVTAVASSVNIRAQAHGGKY